MLSKLKQQNFQNKYVIFSIFIHWQAVWSAVVLKYVHVFNLALN